MGNPDETFQPRCDPPISKVNAKESCKIEPNRCDNDEISEKDNDSSSLKLNCKNLTCLTSSHLHLNGRGVQITHLFIADNDLCEVPLGLSGYLPNLETLVADHNRLAVLPDDIGNCSELRKLSICHNRLTSLPESLLNLKKLKVLRVCSNSLLHLYSEIGQNVVLEEIHACVNKIKRLPSTLGLLKHLHTIKISENNLEQLPSTIEKCVALQTIDLSKNNLEHIPESFGNLKNIVSLDLSANKFNFVCEHLDSSGTLESVNLDHNLLSKFPLWFSVLEKVIEISMKSNRLSADAIPDGFGLKCPNLQFLDLRGNSIEYLPDSIGCLSSLRECLLGTPMQGLNRVSSKFQNGNWLTRFPDDLSKLTSLSLLTADENQVAYLPENFGDLINLQNLYLGSNMICELPSSFTNLQCLRRCQLSRNRLKKLPENFGALTMLTELYLDSNMLRILPSSMSKLVNMEVFDMADNKLKDIPTDVIAGMTNLKALNMFRNKFKVPESEIPHLKMKAEDGVSDYKNQFSGRMSQDGEYLNKTDDMDDLEDECDEEDDVEIVVDDEDWDSQRPASSSASSELTNYMQSCSIHEDDDDWEKDARQVLSRQGSSDIEEGQFDLDDANEDQVYRKVIVPSPVRFDTFGNSSRPIDFAVQHHRQTPYIYHAENMSRNLFIPWASVEGQYSDDDVES